MCDDKELLEAFSQEIGQIKARIKPISEKMKTHYQDGKLFEQFGQAIDGIYGTAATLDFKEVAAYCLALKSINYQTSQVDNMYVRGQIKELDMMAVSLFDKFAAIILNPAEVRKIQYLMKKEADRAEALAKQHFKNVAIRKSVA